MSRLRLPLLLLAVSGLFLIPMPALAAAAAAGAPHVDGAQLSLYWAVPFAGILLSIALFPLFAPEFWHHHFGKISAGWAAAFLLPFLVVHGWQIALYEVLHIILIDYIPFIILLGALYTVAGGIRVTGTLIGTPAVNTGLLATGTALASWMGTTGAAMLLIRPLIRANSFRRYRMHTVVFFIFLVANIGGSLTPLGDPPLFLGFIHGVSFFWPTVHMLEPMMIVTCVVLLSYYVLDFCYFHREPTKAPPAAEIEDGRLGLEGRANLPLLLAVLLAVLLGGAWRTDAGLDIFHVHIGLPSIVSNFLLIVIIALSLRLTRSDTRRRNGFTWFPIVEVAKLFAGIFITIIPALAILRAGEAGALGALVALVSGPDGNPIPAMYFWITGALSSFLDNAPTYLVFFNTAGGDANMLMAQRATTLLAISAGAVFMGAMTYIGNAPNFMVRSIAEERGIKMPSFFAYMAWSVVFLVPPFVLVTWLFFR